MAGAIWVLGESKGTGLSSVSAEVATLGRALSAVSGREVEGIVVGASPDELGRELADFLPHVRSLAEPAAARQALAAAVAPTLATLIAAEKPSYLLVGATADGRDIAGILAVLLGWGVIANASAVEWLAGEPVVEVNVFGGKLLTTSVFDADHGIITIRPTSVVAERQATPGVVVPVVGASADPLPVVSVIERVEEASEAIPIEEAQVIVCAGRGAGGPDGMALAQELADLLGGAVGATRAPVDTGWVAYSQQIGQTGKTVKPQLYIGLGVSGAIQHTVGMQTAETIVSINRDAEAPIAEYADLVVVGDLFTVVPALASALRARSS